MRTIEIRDNDLDTSWLLALMNFPNDEELRNTYYAIHCLQKDLMEAKPTDSLAVDLDSARLLVRAAAGDGIGSRVVENTKRGFVAGEFLLTMFVMYSFPDRFPEPSLRKAIHVAKVRALNVKYGDGSVMPRSSSKILECIYEFKTVAHLWAALRTAVDLVPDRKDVLATPDGLNEFLEFAAALQVFALEFRQRRREKEEQLVSSEEIWRVPRLVPQYKLGWKAPPPWIETALRTYKASSCR